MSSNSNSNSRALVMSLLPADLIASFVAIHVHLTIDPFLPDHYLFVK